MQRKSPLARRPAFGADGLPYGVTAAQNSPWGCPPPDCAPACNPTVLGNAGIPGCGTGTLPGAECHLKIVFRNSGVVPAAGTASFEVLAGRAGAFKPRAVYMVGISNVDPATNVRFTINNILVMGIPQLVSYDGATVLTNRGLTDFFNLQCMPQPVDWAVFGSSAGQGLQFDVTNLDANDAAVLYVAIWGDAADTSLIGICPGVGSPVG